MPPQQLKAAGDGIRILLKLGAHLDVVATLINAVNLRALRHHKTRFQERQRVVADEPAAPPVCLGEIVPANFQRL